MIAPRSTRLSDLFRVSLLLLALATASAAAPSIARLDRADPRRLVPDPDQRAKVGSRCEVHHGQRLRLDLVPIRHGFVTFVPGRSSEDERKRFPNAWPWAGGGCVVGRHEFTEVAYCRDCRAAYQWDKLTLPWMRGR